VPASDTVKELKPTMLVGVSTITGAFTKEVIELMAEINQRPIIFPLSNPTSKAECTYKDAFAWTKGKVVFGSGSPFPSLKGPDGKLYHPAQANNAYISSHF
jgi:malate dehydrogenase (oxaloacetate-decarboxylating)(NADP+)